MSYTRELVERLLPALWDRHFVYSGLDNPYAPDPDMPRVASNPKTANTVYAYLADIKAGWRHAPLDLTDKRVLVLRYGQDLELAAIGAVLGMSKQAVGQRVEHAVGAIRFYLNGEAAEDEQEESITQ
ncbi:sigma factor-like helix-turn-helix DNA-binding protein [Catenuloplanes sp. NPDC051500]|uniref:sigma factor-like helix-turn-helix DNA-binding protein n=1 Tax=Catenuloplanes sp. NPDC051500 TaxID=3363959 RepID=UPI0037B22267